MGLMGRRGFTLLEVMIALAVAGGLLVTLLYTLNHHLDVSSRHEALTVATLLGREKLLSLKAGEQASKGSFPEPYEDYTFEAAIKDSSYPDISEISVVVRHGKESVVFKDLARKDVLSQ